MAGGKNDEFRSDPAGFLAQSLVVVSIQQLTPTSDMNPNGVPTSAMPPTPSL